ncbi:hypothetical protein KAJ87_01550 [Candidatus Pacearchaeota archaeon]|nr:hypothetical protein [Candidatus Pacearchaeota archaeon]
MDLEKQQGLGENYAQAKKGLSFIKFGADVVKVGAGFYVGFMDGQGTPVNPSTRYTFLATPSVLSAVFSTTSNYVFQKMLKYSLKNHPSIFEKNIREYECENNEKEEIQKALKKIAHHNFMPEIFKKSAKDTGITTIKTGVGYAVGYGLAKLI